MDELRVLYIEHEHQNVEANVQAMEAAGCRVDRISDLGDLTGRLSDRYDLILTDAYFLAPGETHESGEQGEYQLDSILKEIRSRDNFRVRVAVLTKFSRELLSKRVQSLEAVDDVWEKRATSQDYLRWQISRIKRKIANRSPDHALLEALAELLANEASEGPWRAEMQGMLSDYRKTVGEREQVDHIVGRLRKIGNSLGEGPLFKKLLEHLTQAEPLNVAGAPSGWGHLRHVINVFWLGYFILNSGHVDISGLAVHLDPQLVKATKAEKVLAVNACWILAALFHDFGLLGERVEEAFRHGRGLIANYSFGELVATDGDGRELAASSWKGVRFRPKGIVEALDGLIEHAGKSEALWLRAMEGRLESKVDHGVLSGVALQKLCRTFENRKLLGKAAVAASIHNFFRWREEVELRLSASESPISALLIFCDNVEIWDRRTGLESRFTRLPLEVAELSRLVVERDKDDGGTRVVAHLNYVPYRYIRPLDSEVESIERELQNILLGQVYPCLNCINWNSDFLPNVGIVPRVYGRSELPVWTPARTVS
jgi:hypothetical protein